MDSPKKSLLFLNKSAFTLAEVLTASVVMLFVLAGVLSVYVMALNLSDVEAMRTKELDDGSLVMEKILRGINGNNGLREAVSFVINSSSNITYSGLDEQVRGFYLSDNKVYFSPANVVVGDDVEALNFTETDGCIDINITFSKTYHGKTYSFKLSESVYPRN